MDQQNGITRLSTLTLYQGSPTFLKLRATSCVHINAKSW